MSEKKPSLADPTPEEIEARLVALRASVVEDVEELALRLAPGTLKTVARTTAAATMTDLRDRAQSAAADLKARARGQEAPLPLASTPKADSASLLDRAQRLFADARDGDPQALAIVTGAAAALAGLSAFALVKALRR
ncbi:hypothetical protein CWT12_01330 [Actinomyces sp. 432]|uniref:hypothetical protein n=1 Tax=Actinomyces sp. 432 TaxID=2057798 RepID=UPI00137448FF|nr:hypothetical protein [Actinomyces sp. 432]QHO90250.1 hypothetical protein CWT12_01330 [Actinomyces sp. 432]